MSTIPPIETTSTSEPGHGFAVTSLVLGVCSVFLFWMYAILPILAIVFGALSMNKQKQAGRKPNGMAVAGLVLGIVFGIFGLLIVLAVIADEVGS